MFLNRGDEFECLLLLVIREMITILSCIKVLIIFVFIILFMLDFIEHFWGYENNAIVRVLIQFFRGNICLDSPLIHCIQ